MTPADIYEAVYLNNSDTLMAWAFRKAVGCPRPRRRGGTAAKVDRYDGIDECFENRKRVLL